MTGMPVEAPPRRAADRARSAIRACVRGGWIVEGVLLLTMAACGRPGTARPSAPPAPELSVVGCYEQRAIPDTTRPVLTPGVYVDTVFLDSAFATVPEWLPGFEGKPGRRVVQLSTEPEDEGRQVLEPLHFWRLRGDTLRLEWHNGLSPEVSLLRLTPGGFEGASELFLDSPEGAARPRWWVTGRRIRCPAAAA